MILNFPLDSGHVRSEFGRKPTLLEKQMLELISSKAELIGGPDISTADGAEKRPLLDPAHHRCPSIHSAREVVRLFKGFRNYMTLTKTCRNPQNTAASCDMKMLRGGRLYSKPTRDVAFWRKGVGPPRLADFYSIPAS